LFLQLKVIYLKLYSLLIPQQHELVVMLRRKGFVAVAVPEVQAKDAEIGKSPFPAFIETDLAFSQHVVCWQFRE